MAGRALRWRAAAAARTKSWRWSRRGRGAAAGSAGGARRGRGRPAERSRRGGAAVYGRGGSFRPRRSRRRREGLAGLRGGQQAGVPPSPAFHRPYASGRVRGSVRGGFGAFVVAAASICSSLGGRVGTLRLSLRLTLRRFCCCCCCAGPRRRAVTAARAPGCVGGSGATRR